MISTDLVKLAVKYFDGFMSKDMSSFPGTYEHVEDETSGAEYYIGMSTAQAVVVFGGTKYLKNIAEDLFFSPVKDTDAQNSGIQVHAGFFDSYQCPGVRGFIHGKLQEWKPKSILCIGHSYGGALTTLTALDVQVSLGILPVVITFGSPRVGNQAFGDFCLKSIPEMISFRNSDDPIPHLPFKDMNFVDPLNPVHIGRKQNPWNFTGNLLKDHYWQTGYRPSLEQYVSE